MANWDKISNRGTVEDRRGTAMGISAAGVTGVLFLMGVTYLLGGNPLSVLQQVDVSQLQTQTTNEQSTEYAGADSYEVFVSTVLGSTDAAWTGYFAAMNKSYQPPELVLFRGYTTSGCGGAQSAAGPHYCPPDQTIYLDETFFDELKNRLGGSNDDVAQAYVIAHEVGHHVQNLLGELGTSRSNEASIATELQADCYAGLWAASIKDQQVLQPGEIQEALDAAAAVGDDHIQEITQGSIHKESWTHGSSAERVAAFTKGYDSGDFAACQ